MSAGPTQTATRPAAKRDPEARPEGLDRQGQSPGDPARAALREASRTLLSVAVDRVLLRVDDVARRIEQLAAAPQPQPEPRPQPQAQPRPQPQAQPRPQPQAQPRPQPQAQPRPQPQAQRRATGRPAENPAENAAEEAAEKPPENEDTGSRWWALLRGLLTPIRSALVKLLRTLLVKVWELIRRLVERLIRTAVRKVEEFFARGGVRARAVLGALRAFLGGRNPIWGAIRGAFGALSPAAKAGVILLLLLALILLPVTVLVLLLVLIVVAVVLWARQATTADA